MLGKLSALIAVGEQWHLATAWRLAEQHARKATSSLRLMSSIVSNRFTTMEVARRGEGMGEREFDLCPRKNEEKSAHMVVVAREVNGTWLNMADRYDRDSYMLRRDQSRCVPRAPRGRCD